MTDARYYHAEHCGVNVDLALEAPEEKGGVFTKEPPETIDTVCLNCGTKLTAVQITRFERERYTALDDDCKNCGQPIVFLPDQLGWYHAQDDREITEVDYGLKTCEAAMVALLGLPAVSLPEYAGMSAEPTNTHVTVDLVTGESETAEEQAERLTQKNIRKSEQKAKIGELSPSFLKSLGG